MKKSSWMAQLYGYLVCLVAVITFLIALTTMVNAVIDLGDPLHSGYTPAGTPSLASFENYKMDVLKSVQKDGASVSPDEQTLRAMYESARNDKIMQVKHQSNRTIIVDAMLIIICLVLFVTHWRWLRTLAKAEPVAA